MQVERNNIDANEHGRLITRHLDTKLSKGTVLYFTFMVGLQ